jgi:hypothetical protein
MGVAIGTAASLGERRSTHTSPARIVQSNVQLTITRRRQLGARRGIRIDKAGRQGLRIADSQREAHSSPHRRFDATRPRGPTAGALRPARRHLANRLERCCLERSPRCRRRYALPCKQTSPRHRVKRIHTSVLGPTSPPPPIGCPFRIKLPLIRALSFRRQPPVPSADLRRASVPTIIRATQRNCFRLML